ncbi:hypothetical protein BLA60_17895 [Actinophytocola xinjiangensis]|uniref:HTH luxR-type domain-containing protein n=1 Tax=Actinophytocola xinjiangensis TaxID=485602 RepID=A0A7Z1AXV1_9PSEU|nr:LuxR family transcriptional regulator [Actinophytocola xinjiangensis]OLF09669.1 hypothetical protein BLA60_17895 [Actinophytocola xinjiangensis]
MALDSAALVDATTSELRRTLVGRDHELASLREVAALAGTSPHIVEIAGEPGTGKTRLLEEFRSRLHRAGWMVATTSSVVGQSLPYQVFVDALDGLLARDTELVRESLGATCADMLSVMFPSWPGAATSAPGAGHDRVDQYRVFRAVGLALEALAGSRGLLVVIDDAHHMDEGSVALLDHVVRHPPDAPLVIALAHRPRQCDVRLAAAIREVPGGASIRRMRTGPIPAEDLAGLLPAETNRVARQGLLRLAAGNPGVLLAFAATATTGPGGEPPDVRELVEGVPPALAGAPTGDFGMLSPLARLVAGAAAVAGDPFSLTVVETVAELDQRDALTGMDELLGHDIVRPFGSLRRFRFRDVVVRSVAYHAVPDAWRHGAHTRAVALFRAMNERPPVIARHLEHVARGDDPADADMLEEAARGCLFESPARAARWLGTANCLRIGQPPAAATLTLLGKALAVAGRLGESETILTGLLGADHRLSPDERVTVAEWCAKVHTLRGRPAEAAAVLHAALAEPGPADLDRSPLHLELAALAVASSGPPLTDEVRDGLRSAAEHDDRLSRLRAHLLLALSCGDSAAGHLRTALRLFGELGERERWCAQESWYLIAETHRRMDLLDSAVALFRTGLDAAVSSGQGYLRTRLATGLRRTLLALGEHEVAAEWADYARTTADTDPHTDPSATVGMDGAVAGVLVTELVLPAARQLRRTVSEYGGPEPTRLAVLDAVRRPDTAKLDAETSRLDSLSRREWEISELVSKGHTNHRIADMLMLSRKTVETYLDRIFKKLEVTSRAQIAYLIGSRARLPGCTPACTAEDPDGPE